MNGDAAAVFQIMSNEISTPKILFCPADKRRIQATTFAGANQSFNNSNLSYFVGRDSDLDSPGTFLLGDDNILVGGSFRGNRFVSGSSINSGLVSLTTNNFVEWSDARHLKQGNIGLADGSVQWFSSSALRAALANTGVETNRLAMP